MDRTTEDRRGISRSLAQAGFLALALYLVHATASPFRIEQDWALARVRLNDGLFSRTSDWAGQSLPYLALGATVAFRFGSGRAAILRVSLFIVFLELAQLLWAGRHPRCMDLGVGLLGTWLGLVLARLALRMRRGRGLSEDSAPRLAALGFVGMTFVAGLGMSSAYHGSSLRDWDDRFPLLIGAEPDGTGIFHGALQDLVVWPRALSDQEMFQAASPVEAARQTTWAETGAAVAWTLRSECETAVGSAAPSLFHNVLADDGKPALQRRSGPVRADASGALQFGGGSYATEPLGNLQRHCIATEGFTIAARCRPSQEHARGGRILAFSEGPRRRNLALIQKGRDLELRVRCGATGWNAIRHPIRWASVLEPGVWASLAVRWDRGRVQLFRDGVPVGSQHWVLETRVRDRAGSGWARLPVILCWFVPLAAFASALARARNSLRLAVLPPLGGLALIGVLVLPSAAQAGAEPPWWTLGGGAACLGIAVSAQIRRVLRAGRAS